MNDRIKEIKERWKHEDDGGWDLSNSYDVREAIAHAPEDIKYLLEENKRMREALKDCAAQIKESRDTNLSDWEATALFLIELWINAALHPSKDNRNK